MKEFQGRLGARRLVYSRPPPGLRRPVGAGERRDEQAGLHAPVDGGQYLLRAQHLRQPRLLGERAREVLHAARRLVVAPEVVGPARQEHVGADEGGGVPSFGVAQGDRERPQDAARSLKAVELGPAHVEQVGQVGMERVAAREPLEAADEELGGVAVLGEHDELLAGERRVAQHAAELLELRGHPSGGAVARRPHSPHSTLMARVAGLDPRSANHVTPSTTTSKSTS